FQAASKKYSVGVLDKLNKLLARTLDHRIKGFALVSNPTLLRTKRQVRSEHHAYVVELKALRRVNAPNLAGTPLIICPHGRRRHSVTQVTSIGLGVPWTREPRQRHIVDQGPVFFGRRPLPAETSSCSRLEALIDARLDRRIQLLGRIQNPEVKGTVYVPLRAVVWLHTQRRGYPPDE